MTTPTVAAGTARLGADSRDVLDLLRGSTDVPVLVLRHAPGGGRGTSLLAPSADAAAALERDLSRHGFRRRGSRWIRFADFTATYVDVTRLDHLGAAPNEVARVLSQALPAGVAPFRVPRLVDELLLFACLFDPTRRAAEHDRLRLHQDLLVEPSVWVDALEHVDAWSNRPALESLRRRYEAGRPPDRSSPPAVIALSGVDGAGKSTQAHALTLALSALGVESSVEWCRVTFTPVLPHVELVVRRLLLARRHERACAVEPQAAPTSDSDTAEDRPTRQLRENHRTLSRAWTTALAAGNAAQHWRGRQAHRHGGCAVVIRDRYVLDSVVHLRTTYGALHDVGVEEALVRRLSPRPLCAFYLDVDPHTAYRRKGEFSTPELERQAVVYRATAAELGVTVVDANRPAEELAEDLAWRVLCALT